MQKTRGSLGNPSNQAGIALARTFASYKFQKTLNKRKIITMLVSQADFARMKNVTPAAVSQWKSEGRLTIVGKMIDLEPTEENLRKYSSHHSKRVKPASRSAIKSAELNVKRERYVNGAEYDCPANLPDIVVDVATAIDSGARGMAQMLAREGLPLDRVRPLVEAWVVEQRQGWCGGPGLPAGACWDWPGAPIGYAGWREHPLFTDPAITAAEWEEIEAEAAVGGVP